MYRDILVIIMLCTVLLYLVGCGEVVDVSPSGNYTANQLNTVESEQGDTVSTECTMIINGKEMAASNYVVINSQSQSAQIPLLAVLSELGAEIFWQDKNIVEITFSNKTINLNKKEPTFGLLVPPGLVNSVRKVLNDEFIVDVVTAKSLLANFIGANITVDYESSVIYINSENRTD